MEAETVDCGIDWFEGTIHEPVETILIDHRVIFPNWIYQGEGRYGYEEVYVAGHCTIWKNGPEGEDHFIATGQGCRDMEEKAGKYLVWRQFLADFLGRDGRLSRLDVFFDVVGGAVHIPALARAIREGRTTSRWKAKSSRQFLSLDPADEEGAGTIYMGSAESNSSVRMYNWSKKHDPAWRHGQPATLRVEMQLRDEVAGAMARTISAFGWRGAQSALRGYLTVWTGTDKKELLPIWKKITAGQAAEALKVQKGRSTDESVREWLRRGVAPSLFAQYCQQENPDEWLLRLLEAGAVAMNARTASSVPRETMSQLSYGSTPLKGGDENDMRREK